LCGDRETGGLRQNEVAIRVWHFPFGFENGIWWQFTSKETSSLPSEGYVVFEPLTPDRIIQNRFMTFNLFMFVQRP
jgi:hypothetical protein